MKPLSRFREEEWRWEDVECLAYKPEGTHFRDVSRQVLFGSETELGCELRYFEIQPGGHTTLERHEHVHAVMILRGQGRVLVGEEIFDARPFDVLRVPPGTWHQLRADAAAPLGFLCLVDARRDRPQRPTPEQLAALRANAELAGFLRV